MSDPTLDLPQLRASLPIAGLGQPLIYEAVIPSTNTLALQLIDQGMGHGTLILTDAQPEGRGRQGRRWVTLPGQQILMSLILQIPYDPHWLVMAASLALAQGLRALGVSSEHIGIKWPNDVEIDGRKIAGILIETTTAPDGERVAALGMGVNVQGSLAPWPEIAARSTTLAAATGTEYRREELLLAFLRAFGEHATALTRRAPGAEQQLYQGWRAQLTTLGRLAHVHQGEQTITGWAEDVAADGALILRLNDGTRQLITWGDVALG